MVHDAAELYGTHKVPSHLNIMRSIPVPEHVINIGAAAGAPSGDTSAIIRW
jgi:hypothetical protein